MHKFLTKLRDQFPSNIYPINATQLAVLAIRIQIEFMHIDSDEIEKTPQALADSIVLEFGSNGK
jgi:hypothetical protein